MSTRQRLRYVALTGAPGTGKSTLLRHLASLGRTVLPEAFRWRMHVLQQTKAESVQDDSLSLLAVQRFLEDVDVSSGEVVFLDRCAIDLSAYNSFYGDGRDPRILASAAREVASELVLAAYSPLCESAYQKDEARDEDLEAALALQDTILSTYRRMGVRLVRLEGPATDERVDCLLQAVGSSL